MASESDRGTLVDSNVLLDLFTSDPTWCAWSFDKIAEAGDRGPLLINHVVYAEVSVRFTQFEELEDALGKEVFLRAELPWTAAFLAGKCYRDYRSRGGTKTSPLPDFFIGAHAAVMKLPLLTRDTARYRTYFPTVELITPEG